MGSRSPWFKPAARRTCNTHRAGATHPHTLPQHHCPWDEWNVCIRRYGRGPGAAAAGAAAPLPGDEMTCAYAAGGGHLAVLRWARPNGCLWSAETPEMAATLA